MANLSYLDLFAGAGGWSVGFEEAEYQHAAMYDLNSSACKTAAANFGPIAHCVDLTDHQSMCFPDVDIVCGSPPCQGFSNEGYKRRHDPRNNLVWTFLEIVKKIQPRAWVFENVPGFQRSYGGYHYHQLMAELKNWDYQFSDFILDAANYGVPQNRQRFVLIAARDFKPKPPVPTHAIDGDLISDNQLTIWDAISDLPKPSLGDRVGEYGYDSGASNPFQSWARKNSARVFNHTTQKHSRRVLEKIRAVPEGSDMSKIVGRFSENRVHYCGGYRRAPKDRPSWTAYWTRGMTSIHPEQHRFLSPRECARIQSFPDRFVFHGSTIENYTQVCNAVPPILARAIAVSVREQVEKTKVRGKARAPLAQIAAYGS
jgi:DNA (cytosine-5)-methyltransferase 1